MNKVFLLFLSLSMSQYVWGSYNPSGMEDSDDSVTSDSSSDDSDGNMTSVSFPSYDANSIDIDSFLNGTSSINSLPASVNNFNLQYFINRILIDYKKNLSLATSSNCMDFEEYIEDSIYHPDQLVRRSPQRKLLKRFKALRTRHDLDSMKDKLEEFEEYIHVPVDMDNVPDQDSFLEVTRDIREKLEDSHELVNKWFRKPLSELDRRIDLARIDQQFFMGHAHRGNFSNSSLVPQKAQEVLNMLVGKIFHITREKGEDEEACRIGSAMMLSISDGRPVNLGNGGAINGILTCAHVLDPDEDEHLVGVYFVANAHLEPATGLPVTGTGVVSTESELISYLKSHANSCEIDRYDIKRRDKDNEIYTIRDNFTYNIRPQYWNNEDICYGYFKNKTLSFDHDVMVKCDVLNAKDDELPSIFAGDNHRYLAIGYPGCPHYSRDKFSTHGSYEYLDDIGLSLLFITSGDSVYENGELVSPSFEQGRIRHKAPTSKGMSGGPLLKIEGDGSIIHIFGCITSGDDDDEKGCY